MAWVAGTWVRNTDRKAQKSIKGNRATGTCRKCGGPIETLRTNTGRVISYEVGMVSHGVLHPCFDLGRGLSKKRADDVEDLFDWGHRTSKK